MKPPPTLGIASPRKGMPLTMPAWANFMTSGCGAGRPVQPVEVRPVARLRKEKP